jgi:hypothetical protein
MVDHPAKARKARRRAPGVGRGGGSAPFKKTDRQSATNGRTDNSPTSLRKSFEKYIELAKAKALAGDAVESEKYYQYAEHLFRVMKGEAA